jgi:hypothetical protein
MEETGYTKLFGSIIYSTIWRESKDTKILWVTMLALANRHGEVAASIPGLADAARLTIDETLVSLEVLESADPFSRNKDNGGRRIGVIDGGWRILNYSVYRAKMRKDAEYYREYRATKCNQVQPSATTHNHLPTISKAKAKAKAETKEEKKKEEKKRASPFVPPTVEEVEQYCKDKGYEVNAKQFIEYYAVAKWHDAKGNPVKSWKQKIISVWGTKNGRTTENRRNTENSTPADFIR